MKHSLILFVATCGAVLLPARGAAAPKPNIIVILADDLGYGDLGCQGSTTIATPRIDRLAREGVRFTDAYVAAPFCSPSRAALLTGRLPARCGVPYVLFPAEHHGMPAAEITLAELLRPHDYATACIGKWHLGADRPFTPQRQGFDVFFGLPYSNDSAEWMIGEPFMQVMGLEPLPLLEGERVVEAPVDQSRLTQRYTERAVAFIRENRERPFFLYLPHTMPHIPQYASPAFAGKSKGGLYGDAIEELDWSTGVIIDTLQELHLAGRTLVIFTSDNGAPLRREAGAPTRGKTKSAAKKPAAPAGERFPGHAQGGDNGQLRGGKGTTFEGGVRVPLLAWWPGTIAGGRADATPVSLMDIFPTCAKLAGAALPSDRIYDGRDLGSGLVRSEPEPGTPVEPRTLFHYFGYQLQAVRQAEWKLLLVVDQRPDPRPASLWFEHQPRVFENQHRLLAEPELYDLRRDPREAQNVAAQHPEIVARLTALAHDFDTAMQRDKRPMEFVAGPPPPAPQTVRTPETDFSRWQKTRGR